MTLYSLSRILPVLFVIGCGAATPVDPGTLDPADYPLTTDRSSYVAVGEGEAPEQYEFTIQATFMNRGPTDVYLARCWPDDELPMFGVYPVAPAGGQVSGYSPNYACAGHEGQMRIPSGTSRTFPLEVFGPTAMDGITKEPLGQMEGTKRLGFLVQSCRGDGACGIPGAGISEPFTVSVVP